MGIRSCHHESDDAEVDESGTGDLDRRHPRRRCRREAGDDLLGELPGRSTGGAGTGHRDVGGEVTVVAPRRPLEVDLGGWLDRQVRQDPAECDGEVVAHGCPAVEGSEVGRAMVLSHPVPG